MEGNFDFTTKPWAPSELKKLKIFKEICTDYRSYKKTLKLRLILTPTQGIHSGSFGLRLDTSETPFY